MKEHAAIELAQRAHLLSLWDAALNAADISGKYAPFMPDVPRGRTIVIGGGKGAAAMAQEFEAVWKAPLTGAVVTRHGYGLSSYSGRIDVLEAGHPVPDAQSVVAGQKMIDLVRGLDADDLVVALISGGASALLVGLPDGVTLDDKQAITQQLLGCGASIGEMNIVRKHLSTIKGGRLARLASPARVVTFAVSDIPGDDIGSIGSGPTIPDNSAATEARAILDKYAISVPPSIDEHLRASEQVELEQDQETNAHLVVTPAGALAAAAHRAKAEGYEPIVLGDDLEGEAVDLGREHAQLALALQNEGRRVCLISGGETTVTIRGKGRGGRNSEYQLALALALKGRKGIAALAADTDGIDGSEDNAGALVFSSTLSRAEQCGLDAQACLYANDSYSFFAGLRDLLITGPTYTNVNDFRAILVDPVPQR